MSNMNQTKCCEKCRFGYFHTHLGSCMCECHSPKSDQSGWEDEFKNTFCKLSYDDYDETLSNVFTNSAKPSDVIDFIRQLLLSQSNALKEGLRKKINLMEPMLIVNNDEYVIKRDVIHLLED